MDEPEYFTEGSFMTYENGVREYITEAEARFNALGHKSQKALGMAFFHKHMLAAAYQLAAFQHAAAIARCAAARF